MLHVEGVLKKRKREEPLPNLPMTAATETTKSPPKAMPESAGNQDKEIPDSTGEKTPLSLGNVQANGTGKRPSRSARRKAAKRRRRRLGLSVVPPKRVCHRKKPQEIRKDSLLVPCSTSKEESSSSDDSSDDSSSSDTSNSSATSSSSIDSKDKSNLNELNNDRVKDLHNQFYTFLDEDQFSTLVPCEPFPNVGAIVAYKLLEVGFDWAPRVSEIRQGKVIAVDFQDNSITLEPYPDSSVHPMEIYKQEFAAKLKIEGAEADEEIMNKAPPPDYDDSGILTVQLSAFVEIRYLEGAPEGITAALRENMPIIAPAGVSGVTGVEETLERKPKEDNKNTKTNTAAAPDEDTPLGPTNYSRLGPPRVPAAILQGSGGSPRPIGGTDVWASLVGQLQQRRAELSTPKEKGVIAVRPASKTAIEEPSMTNRPTGGDTNEKQQEIGKGAASGESVKKGKTHRIRSAMQSAIGPTLRMLRSSEDLK